MKNIHFLLSFLIIGTLALLSSCSSRYRYTVPVISQVASYNEENSEEYPVFDENRFLSAQTHPLSTFSLDVDVASYGNMRRRVDNDEYGYRREFIRLAEAENQMAK